MAEPNHIEEEKRTLILTGASRGIGHATVKRFSSAGWRVITCSRHAFPENCPWAAGPEDPVDAPPHTWITGVFDDEHAFHLTATDDPLRNPAWREHYPNFDRSQSVKFGWLLVGGRRTRIKTASKLTTYDRVTCMPMQIDIQIVDEHDREHRIKGTLVAATPIHLWQNVRVPVGVARWEYEGRIGWGDVQDVQYSDYLLKNG